MKLWEDGDYFFSLTVVMKLKSLFKLLAWIGLALVTVFCVFLIGLILYFQNGLPNVQKLKTVHLQVPLRIFTSNDKLIAEYGNERRRPVTLAKIPQDLIDATLATEDQRYYHHSGVDLLGLARAAVVLVLTGRKEQGGSTITMQVARNYFLTRKKTFVRKFREILLAYKIDHTLSKNKVLELYFNKIFYGNHAYGVAAAAHVYYGKPLEQLTLDQAAMLAGIPQAPSYQNPLANKKAAFARRQHVLGRMLANGYISEDQYQRAIKIPLTATYHGLKVAVKAPYVAAMARNKMLNEYGKKAYTIGLNVYTTINAKLQKDANVALRDGVLAYDKRHGYRGPIENLGTTVPSNLSSWIKSLKKIPTINTLQPAAIVALSDKNKTITVLLKSGKQVTIDWPQMKWARRQFFIKKQEYLGVRPKKPSDFLKIGDVVRTNKINGLWELSQNPQAEGALVAMNPETGGILALDGGFDFVDSNYNRVTQAQRQPGSSFKPFIYSAALNKGFTIASMINDAPVVLASQSEKQFWRPENDTRHFYGMTSLLVGLQQSRNIVAIRLLRLIGIPYAINYATRFGFNANKLPDGLSLALGTAEVTPLQMVTGYSVFANGGYKVTPHLISHVTNSYGKTIFQTTDPVACNKNDCKKSLLDKPKAQRVITPQNAFLMTQLMKAVINGGTGQAAMRLGRHDLAGKTGTTNQKIDAWFSGFNHTLAVTAWMGFDKPRPLYEYGAQAALPIWIHFMGLALKGKPESNLPEPPGIVSVRINPKTGKAASPSLRDGKFIYFRKQYAPSAASHNSTSSQNADLLEQEIY